MPAMQSERNATGIRESEPISKAEPRLPFPTLIAASLLGYGALVIALQLEVLQKIVRGVMGYGGWVWGGTLSDLPTAWSAPTILDDPLRALYNTLILRQPLLPWLAWVIGCAILLVTWRTQHAENTTPVQVDTVEKARAGGERQKSGALAALATVVVVGAIVIAGGWLRTGNLLPGPDGNWKGSNFDEMVYYTQSELLTRGAWAYRDTFMAHPPGVILAFAPALLFEKPWGGPKAFDAARRWLFVYSLLAVPLISLAAYKLGGPASASLAALIMALDGKAAFAPQSDRRLPNVGVLETLVNLVSLVALLIYLYAPLDGKARRAWMLAAGATAGIAALCKVPGLALLLALLIYSLGRRRMGDAGMLLVGAAAGAGIVALPFFVAAPGQMIRQAIFFQLLRPQEVREGIDQAGRIASYPEAQLTLLLAGLGIIAVTFLLWRAHRIGDGNTTAWALPALWAAPVVAVFILGRSFHSQYYTQWVPALALLGSALVARQIWAARRSPARMVVAALIALLALPLCISQWRAAATFTNDDTYKQAGALLTRGITPGEKVMAYDPGYTLAAGLPPARIPAPGAAGEYLVDTAGYTVYIAEEIDRLGWGDLLKKALSADRKRNEEDVLRQPSAQAALLAGAVSANRVVLDQKIALPKLTGQSVKLLEALSNATDAAGFARIIHMNPTEPTAMSPFELGLAVSTLDRLGGDLSPVTGNRGITLSTGEVIQVGLYWRSLNYIHGNLRVVVRFVDVKSGATARQVDTEPSEGSDHTSTWRPGFLYPDIRNIPLAGLAQGQYLIMVRLYDPSSSATSRDEPLPQSLDVR